MDLNLDLAKMICNKLSGDLVKQGKKSCQATTNSCIASFIADVTNYQIDGQMASAQNPRESDANGTPRSMSEDEDELSEISFNELHFRFGLVEERSEAESSDLYSAKLIASAEDVIF